MYSMQHKLVNWYLKVGKAMNYMWSQQIFDNCQFVISIFASPIDVSKYNKLNFIGKTHARPPQTHAPNPLRAGAARREIAATDAQIDRLVYQLYDLTEEEVQICGELL